MSTDDAEAATVLAAVRYCAKHWEPDARIIGNVRAGDIVRSLEEYADRLARSQTALRQISDMGPMSVDDQRWRIAREAVTSEAPASPRQEAS